MAAPTKKVTRAERHRSRDVRRTRFMLAGAVVLSAGILVAWFPAGALYQQRASLAGANAQLAQLHTQDTALTQERKELSSNAEISRIARQQYQLVNPGQQAFEILPPVGTGPATSPFAGDPGTQAPVAPSTSSGLTPGTSAASATHTSHAATAHHQASAGLLNRMLHALEFLALSVPGPSADVQAVTELLGRAPAGSFEVVVRGPDGRPMVIANAPLLQDGTPMPTRYWLVDPEVRTLVSRLESEGGVKEAESAVEPDALSAAHARYATERDALIPPSWTGPRPSGGVGGTRQGVKCLHAHVAWWLTGGDDPVGEWAAGRIALTRVLIQ